MENELRKSGIDCLGDISFGKHICAFYKSKGELKEIVLPFIKSGLENNEACIWVLSENITADEAVRLLEEKTSDVSALIDKGQLKIFDDFYTTCGFDVEGIIGFWEKMESEALKQGYDGLRVTGSANFIKEYQWPDLCDYERDVNKLISQRNMIAMCTYSIDMVGVPEVLAVSANHEILISNKNNKCDMFHAKEKESIIGYFNRVTRTT